MKKILFLLLALSSVLSYGQEVLEHEPVANKAEYYVASYNDRKDMNDLIDWAQDFENWQNESELYDSMASSLLVPYFINDTSTHDVVWLNIWPSPTAQYAGL